MTNYDKTLDRMKYLMEYDNSLNENKKPSNGIEYHVTASDGKEYGIIKEGRRFYIKTTTPDKKEICESYDYIGGFNYRNENGYNSYNEATKQLELRLISINEACGKHEDVSIANLDKTKQALNILTEDARKDLDRMHAIFENSFISKDNIGDHGNPEGKGSATGANTKKNNDPFTETAKASLDKDPSFNGTVEGATEHDKPADPDKKLQNADKMEKGKRGDEDYKDTHDDLEGKGVADQKKSGGKAVKMNESLEEDEIDMNALAAPEDDETFNPDGYKYDDAEAAADSSSDLDLDLDSDIFGDNVEDDLDGEIENNPGDEEGLVGMGDEESDDLDALLEEFMDDPNMAPEAGLDEHIEALDGPNGGDNGISGNDAPKDGKKTMARRVDEDEENHEPEGAGKKESKIVGPDKVMDGPHGGDNGVSGSDAPGDGKKTMARMNEAKLKQTIDKIVEGVYSQLMPKKTKSNKLQETIDKIVAEEVVRLNEEKTKATKHKTTLQEAIEKMVSEELTKLDVWGKHPRFRKEPMSTPANKEVLAGTADDDWNDESARGEHPYGLKVGDGKPFDKAVEMLTDQVLANLKESLGLGK